MPDADLRTVLAALDRAVEAGEIARADYVERRAWARANAGADGRLALPDGWRALDVPSADVAPVTVLDPIAEPPAWSAAALRVLGAVLIVGGLVAGLVEVGASVDTTGSPWAGLATAFSGVLWGAVLMLLARVIAWVRTLTAHVRRLHARADGP